MPPKEKPSKKAVKEKQAKVIEDSTFGLKNKNKSKKVQQFIERVEKTVKNSNGAADAMKAKEAKKEAKLAKQLQEEELRILFNEGIANQFGKKKSKAQEAAEKLGIGESNKDVAKFVEDLSSDDDSDEEDDPNGGVIYVPDEPAVVEVFREKTIEDIIEEQRAKLAAEGKVGTPVTAESFARWRAGKLAQRQAEAEARVKLEQSKKKGGKGLSVLSGKELFNYNASLFVDDDAAIDASEEIALTAETKISELEAEERARADAERAQAEQVRLMEVQRLEEEELKRRDDERRLLAAAADRVTFLLGAVVINQIVFDIEEKEDLEPFATDEGEDEEEEEMGPLGSGSYDEDDDGDDGASDGDAQDGNEEEDEGNNDEEGGGVDVDGAASGSISMLSAKSDDSYVLVEGDSS